MKNQYVRNGHRPAGYDPGTVREAGLLEKSLTRILLEAGSDDEIRHHVEHLGASLNAIRAEVEAEADDEKKAAIGQPLDQISMEAEA